MKLVVKDIDIEAGRFLIALLNQEDARKLDLHHGDRVKIKKGNKETVAFIDISTNPEKLGLGEIGFFEELLNEMKVKEGDVVDMVVAQKPQSVGCIRRKMEGRVLNYEDTKRVVEDIIGNKLSDVELTYFVASTYARGMSLEEITALTRAMIETGDKVELDTHPIMDKHCIGGVPGNRTTPLVVPILAAAGLTIPKTSSRAITSPSGTADTLEVLMTTNVTKDKMIKVVNKTNGCMVWGGGMINLSPADDRIVVIEHSLGIDAEGQMLASILAKKLSVSATDILIDIPVGRGAKVESKEKALHIKNSFEKIAKVFNVKTKVIITDGNQPIGNGIGPMLEAKDVLYVLMNDKRAPKDLEEKGIAMAGLLLEMGGKAAKGEGKKKALSILRSGEALAKFKEIAQSQGKAELDPEKLVEAEFKYEFRAEREGKVTRIDNKAISRVARIAGAPHNKKAGVMLHRKVGDVVLKNQPLFTIYSESATKLQYAYEEFERIDGFVVN